MRDLIGRYAERSGYGCVIVVWTACAVIAYLAGQWADSMAGAVAIAVSLTAGVTAWLTRAFDNLRGPQWPR